MRRAAIRAVGLWLGLLLSSLAWVFATPVLAGPDEFAHVIKAAAVVRGQLAGEQVERPGEYYSVITAVRVPEHYTDARGVVSCFVFQPEVPASCAPPFEAGPVEGTATALTSVGRYPPLTYALVGLPSLWLDGAAAVYAMRVVGAIACTALLALGITVLTAGRRPSPPLTVGIAAAVTPMVLFVSSTVNPSGLEVCAGFALWAVGLRVLVRLEPGQLRRQLLLIAVLAAVVLNTRASSPLLGALIAVVLILAAGSDFRREALRERRWVPAVVVGGCAAAVALVWLRLADPNGGLGGQPAPELASPAAAARAALLESPQYVRHMIGVFGYLDTSAPLAVYVVWSAVLAVLGAAALVVGHRRERLAVVVSAAVLLLLPVVAQVPTAERLGLIWQGRYLLAFAVGVPLLCGVVLHRAGGTLLTRPRAGVLLVVLLFSHVLALLAALRRWSSGTDGPWLAWDGPWQPPPGWAGVLAMALTGFVLVAVVLWPRAVSDSDDDVDGGPVLPLGGAAHPGVALTSAGSAPPAA